MHAGTFSLLGLSCSHALQEAILPVQVCITDELAVSMTLSVWKILTPDGQLSDTTRHIQKAWDTPIVRKIYNGLLISCDTPVDKARLTAVAVTHAGDWLNAPPIAAVGLRLSDEAVCVVVGYPLGSTTSVYVWHSSRLQRTTWPFLQKKFSQAPLTLAVEQPHLACCKEGSNPRN